MAKVQIENRPGEIRVNFVELTTFPGVSGIFGKWQSDNKSIKKVLADATVAAVGQFLGKVTDEHAYVLSDEIMAACKVFILNMPNAVIMPDDEVVADKIAGLVNELVGKLNNLEPLPEDLFGPLPEFDLYRVEGRPAEKYGVLAVLPCCNQCKNYVIWHTGVDRLFVSEEFIPGGWMADRENVKRLAVWMDKLPVRKMYLDGEGLMRGPVEMFDLAGKLFAGVISRNWRMVRKAISGKI